MKTVDEIIRDTVEYMGAVDLKNLTMGELQTYVNILGNIKSITGPDRYAELMSSIATLGVNRPVPMREG